ncbi:hypothetical protein FBU30_000638, partial [Linnemannia zychae]
MDSDQSDKNKGTRISGDKTRNTNEDSTIDGNDQELEANLNVDKGDNKSQERGEEESKNKDELKSGLSTQDNNSGGTIAVSTTG